MPHSIVKPTVGFLLSVAMQVPAAATMSLDVDLESTRLNNGPDLLFVRTVNKVVESKHTRMPVE